MTCPWRDSYVQGSIFHLPWAYCFSSKIHTAISYPTEDKKRAFFLSPLGLKDRSGPLSSLRWAVILILSPLWPVNSWPRHTCVKSVGQDSMSREGNLSFLASISVVLSFLSSYGLLFVSRSHSDLEFYLLSSTSILLPHASILGTLLYYNLVRPASLAGHPQ